MRRAFVCALAHWEYRAQRYHFGINRTDHPVAEFGALASRHPLSDRRFCLGQVTDRPAATRCGENAKAISRNVGAPGGTRTHDPWLRRPVLYPAELQARVLVGRDQRASVRGRRATGVANDQDACATRRLARISDASGEDTGSPATRPTRGAPICAAFALIASRLPASRAAPDQRFVGALHRADILRADFLGFEATAVEPALTLRPGRQFQLHRTANRILPATPLTDHVL